MKGQSTLLAIPMIVIGLVIAIVMVYNVGLPVTNTAITSTSANLTGYAGALQISQQLPLMEALLPFAAASGAVLFILRVVS